MIADCEINLPYRYISDETEGSVAINQKHLSVISQTGPRLLTKKLPQECKLSLPVTTWCGFKDCGKAEK